MSFRALFYAYVLGGLTFIPLIIFIFIGITIYTSVPVASESPKDDDPKVHTGSTELQEEQEPLLELNDQPKTRKGWLTVRHTFEESTFDGSYVTLVRSYLDARSKDPRRSRPKDMWFVVLKGKVLYLYEDESMTECGAAVELGGHEVSVYPEGLLDGELYTRRNAICLRPRQQSEDNVMSSVTRETVLEDVNLDEKAEEAGGNVKKQASEHERLVEEEKSHEPPRQGAVATSAPWFIFVRSCVEMEDWYLALVHTSENPTGTPTLSSLCGVFLPSEMNQLVMTLDEQPDVIPMRWLNALIGRIFYSFYRTQLLESFIIGRIMKKLSKVKRPAFLTDIAVTEFCIGNKAPTLSKPMLKELTKEGDASLEVRFVYKGEIRATVEATATINLGARFKSYAVKLVLAVIVRELDGNLLIKVKRPPSSRIWYAFTQTPRMVIDVEPIVSDRQITWSMILDTIKSRLIEVIQESVVMPNMDDISFFDSSPYAHRGGLWSDAARCEKSAPASTSQEADSVKPVVSEPDLSLTVAASEEDAAPTVRRSDSIEVEVSPFETVPVIRTMTNGTSGSNSKNSRRRSWFSSGGDESDVGQGEVEESDSVRGRRSRSTSAATPRQETPAIPSPAKPADVVEVDDKTPEFLSSHYQGRSSSVNSQTCSRSSRTDSISSSVGGDEFSNYLSDSGVASKSPRSSTTASSFLSTLKSRAADKQALSNSAKEAMRKLGVNWGLKKDINVNGSQDDIPDVGHVDARIRTDSPHGRPSYAEVRAAVTERRERRDDSGSAPIPIPNEKGSRSTSTSSGHMASSTGAGVSISPSLVSQGGSSEGSSKFIAPSVSRSATENGMADPLKDRDFTDISEEHPRLPSIIHTQPSQARMTIPGIHASHRGEPLSMGNIAPSPALENKSKGPAIQSMYRLWKSPILAGQQPGADDQTTARAESDERNADVAPLSLSAEVTSPPPRVIPPPLPPRAISSNIVVRHTVDSSIAPSTSPASDSLKNIAEREEMKRASPVHALSLLSPEVNESSPADTPPELDTAKRSGNGRPPLPPRRMQAPG